ncbi:MAG: DUF1456 family protein [Saprospiraceae bacterium]|nr:DUF1456 family protein [Saprospiraceae bacterium]
MNNNDIIRRIRYTFNFSDSKMIELFSLGSLEVTRAQISDWMKKEDDPAHIEIEDELLATFLNGLIVNNRGKKEGVELIPEKRLNNNIIFRKLKIALNLRDTDIIDILQLADFKVSSHEINALFRNPKQRQYRICKDQFLRNFLHGMQLRYRGKKTDS